MNCDVKVKAAYVHISQWHDVQRPHVGLAHEARVSRGRVCPDEHVQAPDQQALDLHYVSLTQLELVLPQGTVVLHGHTRTPHWKVKVQGDNIENRGLDGPTAG